MYSYNLLAVRPSDIYNVLPHELAGRERRQAQSLNVYSAGELCWTVGSCEALSCDCRAGGAAVS